jgi:hypothetical protein
MDYGLASLGWGRMDITARCGAFDGGRLSIAEDFDVTFSNGVSWMYHT